MIDLRIERVARRYNSQGTPPQDLVRTHDASHGIIGAAPSRSQ
jgi:hypothetical protein